MTKNKNLIILISILIILILIIIYLLFNIKNKSSFIKPEFDSNASIMIPQNLDYKSAIIEISDGYSIYIDGKPHIDNDSLIVNFVSVENNTLWIKIRVLDDKENVVAESGLIKPGEYLKSIKLDRKISVNDSMTYMIIGYEMDSYKSAGTIELNTKVGN